MARPKSDDRRNAITSAAIGIISREGLAATTAEIAKEAGISNGSLFTYFGTKTDLLNHVYVELKSEMASGALDGLSAHASNREQLHHMWAGWMRWATASPQKRRALAHLQVSDEVTAESHRLAGQKMASVAALLERSRANGPMREAPLAFVVALMNAVADATIGHMLADPINAETHSRDGFEAMWRIIA